MLKRGRRELRLAVAAALVASLGIAALPGAARAAAISADEVLVRESTLVTSQQSNVYAFTLAGPGTVTVDVQDVVWPAALQSLSFSLDSPQRVLGWVGSAGALTLSVATGGTYYTDVTAQASGSLDLGLYSVQVDFVPQGASVPLPASLTMLLCGLGALGLWGFGLRNESFMYAV